MTLNYKDRQTSNEKAANTQYFALIKVHKKYCGACNYAKVTIKTNNTHNIQKNLLRQTSLRRTPP